MIESQYHRGSEIHDLRALIRSFEIVPELVAAKGSETKDEIMHN